MPPCVIIQKFTGFFLLFPQKISTHYKSYLKPGCDTRKVYIVQILCPLTWLQNSFYMLEGNQKQITYFKHQCILKIEVESKSKYLLTLVKGVLWHFQRGFDISLLPLYINCTPVESLLANRSQSNL